MAEPFFTITSENEQNTQRLAAALAACCRPGDCLLLKGDLGTGKTAFARGFIWALHEGEEEVVSPTFTLVQTYPTRAGWPVWHFDLYRLKSARELDQIGIDEALETGVTLIEWPEIAENRLPEQALTVCFNHAGESRRTVALCGDGARWKTCLGSMA